MEEDWYLSTRPNPRNLGFLTEHGGVGSSSITNNKMPSELIPKLPSPILDRFRALVNAREEELRVSEEDEDVDDLGGGVSTEDIVRIYDIVLSELTFNSKPIITDLTIIADEQRDCAAGIADVICNRIMESVITLSVNKLRKNGEVASIIGGINVVVPYSLKRLFQVSAEQKLPSLYLLDSIVKNIGNVYVKYFASRIHEVFCEAYKQVHPSQHPAMRHLFGTWSDVFPLPVLHRIGSELHFSAPINHQSSESTALRSSETTSPRPAHGIHVNPKYLEARRQFEHATVDVQHGRGISSSLQILGKKPTLGYGEYDADHSEIISPQVRTRKLSLSGIEAHTSSVGGAERMHPSKKRHLSPSGLRPAGSLSPSGDGFVIDNSPERASPSHCGFEYGPPRMVGRDGERSDWWMKHRTDNNRQVIETSTTYNPDDADDQQRPRALIDAYGNYRGKNSLNEKSLKVPRFDVNSINSEANVRSWQNTEEEEYVWEDMSPTLTDRRSNGSMPSNPPLGGIMTRTGFGRAVGALAEPDFRRSNWSRQGVLDSAIIAEDGISILGIFGGTQLAEPMFMNSYMNMATYVLQPGGGTIGKNPVGVPQTQHKSAQIQGSPYSQEPWSLPGHFSQAFQQHNSEASGRVVQMPFGASGTPSAGQRLPSLIDNIYNQRQPAHLPSQFFKPQEAREGFIPSIPAQMSAHLVAPPLNHGHSPQVGAVSSTTSLNQIPGLPFSVATVRNFPNTSSFQLPGQGASPPLPPGPPPSSSHMRPTSHIMGPIASQPPVSSGLSGLISPGLLSNLMAQGLISLTPNPVQGSVLVEFDPDLLKVRHESGITALYADLPRQCTTCGLRFKGQEEHSSHMDWHVTRNRTSRNKKQKSSRKWFVSSSLWLSSSEAVGPDLAGLLPTESVSEKKSGEEMAVPADENQITCALCGEPFDDFYSDETEEWMYRGAVYLNAPDGSTTDGSTTGLDRSPRGPIVHAKCRSGSSVPLLEGFGRDETGNAR